MQGYTFRFKFQNTYWEFELSRNDSRMRLLGLGPHTGRALILKFLRSHERKKLVASPTPSWIFWAKCNYWATLMPHLSFHSSLYDYVFFFWRTKSEIMSWPTSYYIIHPHTWSFKKVAWKTIHTLNVEYQKKVAL